MAKVIDQQVRVSIVFWVKENEDSPYQGLLTFDPDEFAKLNPKEFEARQLEQFDAWKVVRDAPTKEVTREDKERMLADVRAQKDDVARAEAALVAELETDPKAEVIDDVAAAVDPGPVK